MKFSGVAELVAVLPTAQSGLVSEHFPGTERPRACCSRCLVFYQGHNRVNLTGVQLPVFDLQKPVSDFPGLRPVPSAHYDVRSSAYLLGLLEGPCRQSSLHAQEQAFVSWGAV